MLIDKRHATHALQVNRQARETHHEARRRFADATELTAWLGEVCGPAERAAVAAFLARR